MIMDKRIYCAGPSFSPEDCTQLADIETMLKTQGLMTYLPHKDGLYAHFIEYLASSRQRAPLLSRAVFACNVFNLIECCDGVVFSLNGRVPDEGGIMTAAISFIVGKPVVLYKMDIRGKIAGDDNAMITGLSCKFKSISKLKQIPLEIKRAMAKMAKKNSPYQYPLNVKTAVELGGRIQEVIDQKFSNEMDNQPQVLEEIMDLCEESEWHQKFAI
jgi:nucleoside 2-deoxyribosyltransferase